MTDPSVLNFAYGSNLDPHLMASRCVGDCARVGAAVLRDYRLAFEGYAPRDAGPFARGSAVYVPAVFATVRPAPGAVVHGLLYRVGARGLRQLDRCEGVPSLYLRETVTVELADGSTAEACTYLHQGGHRGPPDAGYLDGILQGYLREGFPTGPLASASMTAHRLAGFPFGGGR